MSAKFTFLIIVTMLGLSGLGAMAITKSNRDNLPILAATATPTLFPQTADSSGDWAKIIQPSPGCDFPCWWGITPGHTTFQEAQALLESKFAFTEFEISERWGEFWGSFWIDDDSGGQVMSEAINFFMRVNNHGIVDEIRIDKLEGTRFTASTWPYFSVPNLITIYGIPDEIYIGAGEVTWGTNIGSMSFLWHSIGLTVYYWAESELDGNAIVENQQGTNCFKLDEIWTIQVWLHDPSQLPPYSDYTEDESDIPLAEALTLTIPEFVDLLIAGDECLPQDLPLK